MQIIIVSINIRSYSDIFGFMRLLGESTGFIYSLASGGDRCVESEKGQVSCAFRQHLDDSLLGPLKYDNDNKNR